MPSIAATRRASSTADSEQQPPCRAVSSASPRGHCWRVIPTTSCPSRTSSAAATLESTPPERATAIFTGGQSMTIGDDFSALRDQFWQHYTSGRRQEALAVAERAWDGFPERRGYAWLFLAAAHCGLGRPEAALEALERAESENHLWRLQLLRVPELESLRADPRFGALAGRAQARVASRNFQPRLLLAEPEPANTKPTLLLGLHGATSTADEYHRHWLPATRLGCMVASAQSSQPATDTAFCWDDRSQVRRDLESLIDNLPEHSEIVLTGFSQGALVALDVALTGEPLAAAGVIAVAPSFPA